MKTTRLIVIASVLFSCLSAVPSEEAFSKKLLDVYRRADVDDFLSLVENDESTPKEIRDQHRENFLYNAKRKASGAKFEALTGMEITSYEKDGQTMAATLTPVIKIVVSFDDEAEQPKLLAFTHLLGIKGDEYRIVSVKIQKKPNSEGSTSNALVLDALNESPFSGEQEAERGRIEKLFEGLTDFASLERMFGKADSRMASHIMPPHLLGACIYSRYERVTFVALRYSRVSILLDIDVVVSSKGALVAILLTKKGPDIEGSSAPQHAG